MVAMNQPCLSLLKSAFTCILPALPTEVVLQRDFTARDSATRIVSVPELRGPFATF
jgi:hypothetical protein